MTGERASQRLLSFDDERAIERLIYDVAWLIDSGRADQVHASFTEDAVVTGAGPADLLGRTMIREWGESRARARRTSRHVLSNVRVEALSDDRARASAYLLLYRRDEDEPGSTLPFLVGDSVDDLSRGEDGAWRIARRQVHAAFATSPAPARS